MSIVTVQDLRKNYYVSKKEQGILQNVKGLLKREKITIYALCGISFSIQRGEFVGFIGPNGAGKSTTLKILTGILVPDSGNCSVLDKTPWKSRIALASKLGVVFGQKTQLWWDLPVIDSFDLLKDIYRIPISLYRKNKTEMIELLQIDAFLNTPVRQLSLGQRMRADLAASLLHDPEILFLDEPTIGLDAPTKVSLRKFLQQINQNKHITILLTTHDTRDIETLCPRVIFINHGSLIRDGSLQDFREELQKEANEPIESVEDLFVRLYKEELP